MSAAQCIRKCSDGVSDVDGGWNCVHVWGTGMHLGEGACIGLSTWEGVIVWW